MIKYTNNNKFMNRFYNYLDNNLDCLYAGNYDNSVRKLVQNYIDTRFEDTLYTFYPDYLIDDIIRRDNNTILTSMAFDYLDPLFMTIKIA